MLHHRLISLAAGLTATLAVAAPAGASVVASGVLHPGDRSPLDVPGNRDIRLGQPVPDGSQLQTRKVDLRPGERQKLIITCPAGTRQRSIGVVDSPSLGRPGIAFPTYTRRSVVARLSLTSKAEHHSRFTLAVACRDDG